MHGAKVHAFALASLYESPTCGAHDSGSRADTQNCGGTLVAYRAAIDSALVRLGRSPSSAYNVTSAGSGANAISTARSIGTHHPSGRARAIIQNTQTLTIMNNRIGIGGSSTATHGQTGLHSQGTTEPGSSGAALVIQANAPGGSGGRLIGTLSGGGAACSGSVLNNQPDCTGKFSVAFDGASAS